jgi:hypothetical protein
VKCDLGGGGVQYRVDLVRRVQSNQSESNFPFTLTPDKIFNIEVRIIFASRHTQRNILEIPISIWDPRVGYPDLWFSSVSPIGAR